jgi:hypothetical protein
MLLTGTAGCLGAAPTAPGDGGTADGDDEATTDGEGIPDGDGGTGGDGSDTRPEGTGGPGVTVVSTDPDPELPVTPSVGIVREAATTDHPPRLRTTLENTGPEAVRVGEGRAVHFEYVADDSGALFLLPADGEYPAEPDCWRLTEPIATTEEYRMFGIDAGESSERLVDLYAAPGGDACLPVGEHRFETTVSIVGDDAEPEASATWGFTILLE